MNLRIRALERRKLPEELDHLSGLAGSWTGLGVGALTLAVAALVIWGFAGNVPRTVNGTGVLAQPNGLAMVQSTVRGSVMRVLISQNATVHDGEAVATVRRRGRLIAIKAPFTGQVIDLEMIPGQVVSFGAPLYTLQRDAPSAAGTSVYLFIRARDGAGLAPGMKVNVSVASAPSAAYGVLRGEITRVSASPLSTAAIAALVANPNLASVLAKAGPPLLAQVRLTADRSTRSGFAWSTPKGPPFPLAAGTPVTAQVVESEQRPVNVIFGT